MSVLTAVQAQRRFLTLLGLRWLPVGLLIPATVLLALERGLSIAQVGAVAVAQGLTVMILELPTGGLSDAIGRRPVLLLAGAVNLASLTVLAFAHSASLFFAYFLLQGVYRALDSGPLEAWYVDHALAADEKADIEIGLSRSGVVLGMAIGGGALISGGIVALGPIGPASALTVPVLIAIVLSVVSTIAVAALMTEARPARGLVALIASARGVPAAIGGALRLVRRSRVVAALILVELFWGFGMATFETLMPVRLSEVLGDAGDAAALMGPVASAGWAASAAGAALIPFLARRIGAPWTGFVLRIAQGVTVVGMGLFAGPAGIIAAYLLCYAVHGAANPVHVGLLHRQVEGPYRTSLLSLNSMVGQPGSALGLVTLTAVAAAVNTSTAMYVGAAVLAVAAPLYLAGPARPDEPVVARGDLAVVQGGVSPQR
ncbi:MAG TPA: MFS transporter [Actinoplanes sp.]|nr:MFS transporter [Actinoplanes sp.]